MSSQLNLMYCLMQDVTLENFRNFKMPEPEIWNDLNLLKISYVTLKKNREIILA